MYLESLAYFVAICDQRSITRASKELYISQQNLSLAMHNLEKELGTALLVRTNKGVYPTEFGKKVYYFAKNTIDNWTSLKREAISQYNESLTGTFITNSTPNYLPAFLPEMTVLGRTNFKNLEQDGSIDTLEHIIKQLLTFQIDCGNVILYYENSYKECIIYKDILFKPYFECHLYGWVNNASPLASKNSLTLDEALTQSFLRDSSFDYDLFKMLLGKNYDAFLEKSTYYPQQAITTQFVNDGAYALFDIKMGPYGLSYDNNFKYKPVVSIPIKLNTNKKIYAGCLINAKSPNLKTIKAVTSNYINWD